MRERPHIPALVLALAVGGIPSTVRGAVDASGRRGPNFLFVEPATGTLLVLCEKSDSIARVHAETGAIEAEATVGGSPFAFCRHPDGNRLYVSCRAGQEVVELDARTLEILRRFSLRGDPTGVAVSADGKRLYVGVHSLDQVAVFDVDSGTEIKRLAAGNGPQQIRLSPAEGLVYVTNLLSNPVPPDQPCRNEITVIDDDTARVVERIMLVNANIGRCIDFLADGKLGIMAISRPKNLIPMVQVARGWVVTNGFVVLSPGSDVPPVQLLIDLPNQAYADPYGIALTPDGGKFYLSCAGADTVLAVDVAKVREVVDEAVAGRIPRYADHLGLSRRYVTARIAVGANPQALTISADGRSLYVANRLDDTISVIDTESDETVRTLVLGKPPASDRMLRGEYLFHSAARTFQGQFSCVSCHPDGGFDGLVYDLEPDGIGEDIVDNRSMRGLDGTAPFKWIGTNPDIATQCGTRTAKWIVRTGWLNSMQVVNLAGYIRSIQPVSNPYREPIEKLSPAQRRGQAVFERTTTNDGQSIIDRDRCHFCHAGPTGTNGTVFDVGTKGPRDRKAGFDTPHLKNIFESAPYLHDGRAATLEEIWTRHNPDDRHGISNDWTKQQLNDLVEYLKAF